LRLNALVINDIVVYNYLFKCVHCGTTARTRLHSSRLDRHTSRVTPLLREPAVDEFGEDEGDFVPGVWWHSQWRHGPGITGFDSSYCLLEWHRFFATHG